MVKTEFNERPTFIPHFLILKWQIRLFNMSVKFIVASLSHLIYYGRFGYYVVFINSLA